MGSFFRTASGRSEDVYKRQALPSLAAALVWELAVFALALGAAWLMRRVPGLRKII